MDSVEDRNKALIRNFVDAINRRDMQEVIGMMSSEYHVHELAGDHKNDLQNGGKEFRANMQRMSDLRVDVRDIFVEGEKVFARVVWIGTEDSTGEKLEYHGFAQWKIRNDQIIEHWQAYTELKNLNAQIHQW